MKEILILTFRSFVLGFQILSLGDFHRVALIVSAVQAVLERVDWDGFLFALPSVNKEETKLSEFDSR